MTRIDITTEPFLDIEETAEGAFEIPDEMWHLLLDACLKVAAINRRIIRHVVDSHPDHPDVPYLVEYLKEQR